MENPQGVLDSSTDGNPIETAPTSVSSLDEDIVEPQLQDEQENPEPVQSQSVVTASQTEYSSQDASNCAFRKHPLLAKYFIRCKANNNRNYLTECKFCQKKFNDNRQDRLLQHITVGCVLVDPKLKQELVSYSKKVSEFDQPMMEAASALFMKVISKNGLPMRLADCKLFKSFLKMFNPAAEIPTRSELSLKYLPNLASEVQQKFLAYLQTRGSHHVSIEFDHWTDLSNRSMLGIVATQQDGKRYLVQLEDVSSVGHYSDSIVESLKHALSTIPLKAINSIVSDSDASCKAARNKLVKGNEYKSVIQHRCLAHLFNSIGGKFCQNKRVSRIKKAAKVLASFASNNQALRLKLKAANKRRISLATDVRWYSTVTMFETLLEGKDEICDHLPSISPKLEKVRDTIANDEFWNELPRFISILKPLCNCIAVAEQASGSVAEGVRAILEFARSIFNADWSDQLVKIALRSFLHYFNIFKLGEGEMGLLVAAYAADPRFNMDYLTIDGKEMALRAFITIALQSGYRADQVKFGLGCDFKRLCKQESPFNTAIDDLESSSDWWSRLACSSVIKDVATRLSNLKSSSANIERVFSMIKICQSPVRTNYSAETLKNLTRAKLYLLENDVDELIQESYSHLRLSKRSNESDRIELSDSEDEVGYDEETSSGEQFDSSTEILSSTPLPSRKRSRLNVLEHCNGTVTDEPSRILSQSPASTSSDSNQARGPRPILLDSETAEHYYSFCKWFDFAIINKPDPRIDETNDSNVKDVVEDILSDFRLAM